MKWTPLICACVACCANAEIYQWKDEKGQTHFSDVRPAAQAKVVNPVIHSVYESPASAGYTRSGSYNPEYQQKLENRRQEELKRQQTARLDEKRARKCEEARADSRRSYTRTASADMNRLRQIRAEKDEINRRIKENCY
ncbi:DUF4124 domain-containing protein [uncultured Thalassolituus sp.]|uniref:DUF4124 domain-containing protein n=1 Tax=uncultured Thalassolituus sp. TaxID=285273 RepID=UPI002636AC9B|nr:DUF4124 domain-containing protein [uncultured Thalassolituus sp.]